MKNGSLAAALVAAVLLVPGRAHPDDVTYYEKDGVTYRETRRVVRRPITETRYEQRERTVYREEYSTETQETYRTVFVPVTEYRWEAHWRNRFNPFAQPYLEQRLVPRTHFEPRTEVVRTPVTRRQLVPEVRQEQVPVISRRMVEEEVISRVAVGGPAGTRSAGNIARGNGVGGVARLDAPPGYEQGSTWRPSNATVRR